MNKFKNTKKIYDDIEIPEKLKYTVNHSIELAEHSHRKNSKLKPFFYSLATVSVAFIIALNTSETFAKAMSEIPIINMLSTIFTINTYQSHDKVKIVDVSVPALKDTGNSALEEKINNQIQKQIDETVEKAKLRAREHYDNYIAAGYEASSFLPVEIIVDYEVKCATDQIASFIITHLQGHVSVETTKTFYNINLKNGESFNLQQLLGDNYAAIINPQIKSQIKKRQAADGNELFFDEEGAFQGIRADQPFYINEQGKLVIVFEKYEIAPGYMGFPEFVIDADIIF